MREGERGAAEAERLFARFRARILADPEIPPLLEAARRSAEEHRARLRALGAASVCSDCASGNGGAGCCGDWVAEVTEPATLLSNLLLGVRLKPQASVRGACPWLGPSGCTLLIRYHFCSSYICGRLRGALGLRAVRELEEAAGREIHSAWLLERRLMRLLGGPGCPS